MELTFEDRAILAHVVMDPDAWVAHAIKTVGEGAVRAKIERWRKPYLVAKESKDYKNRTERQAIEDAEIKPTPEQTLKMQQEKLIQDKMREIAIKELVAEGKLTG